MSGSENNAERVQGVYDNLAPLAAEIALKLSSDELARLNACVTELQSICQTEGREGAPTHAPMEAPYPTVQNPPRPPAENGNEEPGPEAA